jgi:thioester reductase-like protein
MKTLFMTGITGFVGGEVIKRYLDRAPDLHIVGMIRAVDEARLAKRSAKLLKAIFGDDADAVRDRFTFVRGDLLKEHLGMSDEDRDLVVNECDSVLHCAASVDFGATLEYSREYNLDGTRRVLELCERMGSRLERLDYISTAYVSGNRNDICLETELSNRGELLRAEQV